MPTEDQFWATKAEALLCRVPGEMEPVGPETVLQADQVAFALHPQRGSRGQAVWPDVLRVQHPLTGEMRPLDGLAGMDWPAVSAAIRARAERLGRDAAAARADGARARYLALWRLLAEPPVDLPGPDAARAAALRRWWRLLPAHPDTPACLLWEHQGLVAALAGTADASGVLRPALVQFNIADTQPFVTLARRTQDLWAGSYLLSFLCWTLLRHFASAYGPDCVLQPLLRGQPLADRWLRDQVGLSGLNAPGEERLKISNIPNIFTLILPEGDVADAVEQATAAARDQWAQISESAREAFQTAAGCSGRDWAGCDDIWKRQQDTFLTDNLFWAALPLPAGPLDAAGLADWRARCGPYLPPATGYRHVEAALAAHPDEATGGLLYGLCSQLTAQLLSDRKRQRDFTQVDEPGQKCSLSGALQAVYPPPPAGRAELPWAREWWEALAGFDPRGMAGRARFKMAGRIRRGDRLCAIQATKRLMIQTYFGEEHAAAPRFDRHQFPSTAGIANARLLTGIVRAARSEGPARAAVAGYVRAVRDGLLTDKYHYPASLLPAWTKAAGGDGLLRDFLRIDGDCLLEEFYDPVGLEREFGAGIAAADFPERLAAARQARDALLAAVRGRPSRYYAIVAVDGDEMGQWISGRKTPDRPLGPALHLAFTAALSGFALEDAGRVVEEEHAGKLVYAGGDDVLALVPVPDLLPVLDGLYRAFRGQEQRSQAGASLGFSGFVEAGAGDDARVELRLGAATLSAGAVIAHEAVPLTYALEQARAAECDAKERHGRDAFAVRLLKRSGAPVEIGAKWRAGGVDVPAAVATAAELMRAERLSSKLVYAMEGSRLEVTGGAWAPDALAAAQRAEFRRLADRHVRAESERAATRRALEPLSRLVALADPPRARVKAVGWEDGWAAVQGLLRLARMIGTEA